MNTDNEVNGNLRTYREIAKSQRDESVSSLPEPPVNKRLVLQLVDSWKEKLPSMPCPPYAVFARWLRWLEQDFDALNFAIAKAADRLTRQPFADAQHPAAFVSATAKRRHAEKLREAIKQVAA